ncbi:MAG: hypothetical protein N2747_04345 [Chitinophagaceae bacterium]|nr:hypothetical protein [Chitinophagaceae bacterium]
MKDKQLDEWIAQSGLTKTECALIQPAYGGPEETRYVAPSYGIASSVFTGLNAALNFTTFSAKTKTLHQKGIYKLGIISGFGQLTIGIIKYPKKIEGWGGFYQNHAQRNLSLLNMGLGAATVLLNASNLALNKKQKEKSLTWDIYSVPSASNQYTVGLRVIKDF